MAREMRDIMAGIEGSEFSDNIEISSEDMLNGGDANGNSVGNEVEVTKPKKKRKTKAEGATRILNWNEREKVALVKQMTKYHYFLYGNGINLITSEKRLEILTEIKTKVVL